MSKPALLRRLPPLRDRDKDADDPLQDVRSRTDAPFDADKLADVDSLLKPAFETADKGADRAQDRWARRELSLLWLSGLLVIASSVQAAWGEQNPWPGAVVAVLGGLSSVLAANAKSTDARRLYLRLRWEAERLRSLAWTYLTVAGAAGREERRQTLISAVAHIRLQAVEGVPTDELAAPDPQGAPPPPQNTKPAPVTPDPHSEELLAIYLSGRLAGQRRWYLDRQSEFQEAERQGRHTRTFLLMLATVFGALASPLPNEAAPWLGIAATAATAASAIITGWMRLQAFDERAHLYELTAARIAVEEADRPTHVDAVVASAFIAECENLLLAEHSAWASQTPQGARETSTGASSRA